MSFIAYTSYELANHTEMLLLNGLVVHLNKAQLKKLSIKKIFNNKADFRSISLTIYLQFFPSCCSTALKQIL